MQGIAALVHAGIVAPKRLDRLVADAIGRLLHGHSLGHSSDAAAPPEVTVQLVCVCTAECWPVLVQPFKEGDVSERGLM